MDTKPGIMLIRGAAGSGKTTTAILHLKQLVSVYAGRRRRMASPDPIRVLVLCFNRTLRGYVENLVENNIPRIKGANVDVTLDTFGRWSKQLLPSCSLFDDNERRNQLHRIVQGWPHSAEFLLDEIDYVLGRYLPYQRNNYLTDSRIGRGRSPRFQSPARKHLLEQVIEPYERWKDARGVRDWNDLAVALASSLPSRRYDLILVDEAQDFSANQIRAVTSHAMDESSVTFLLDSAQRIYVRGFTWKEVAVDVSSRNSHKLAINYRNTFEIACFVQPLLYGMDIDDDGVIPDPSACKRHGPRPILVTGKYLEQVRFTIRHIQQNIDLSTDSVAFLHPKGWFKELRKQLRSASLAFVEMTRENEWPTGPENIALSTMHSAKGLEFDHVFILGFNREVALHGDEDEDDDRLRLRRLLAMAISRARTQVILGYKPSDRSDLLDLLDPATYEEHML